MTIELYTASGARTAETIDPPISSTAGLLPDQEPTLELGDLLGSFDSKDEAIAFAVNQIEQENRIITDRQIVTFDAYAHVEGLTIRSQIEGQPAQRNTYYLVTDEGY